MAGRAWSWTLPRVDTPSSAQARSSRSVPSLGLGRLPYQVCIALLVAAGYYLGTRIGFFLTPREFPISTFWPPNAVLLAAFLLAPYRVWWLFVLAVFPTHLLIQLTAGIPVATACGWFISNTAEALLGAALIRRFRKAEELFESVHGVLLFLAFAVVLAPLASSFVDAGVVVTTGFANGYWKLWTARLFSNMLAAVTIAPAIIVVWLNGRRWARHITRSRLLEATLLAIGIAGVSSVVFGRVTATSPALMYSPLPLVVWIVVRFGVGGLYPSLLAMSLISIWDATHGRDPFLMAPIAESILGIQIFLCTIALPMMLLAAVLAERKVVEETLRESRVRLIDAQEQERRRIARELHDDIGQQLTVLELELEQLSRQANAPLQSSLHKLYRQVSATSAAARTMSHELHSAHLDLLGLVPAVRSLCQTLAGETSIEVAFIPQHVPLDLDPQVSLCLYRVTQEALHNVARHSHARNAAVRLQGNSAAMSLEIVDDGVGISAQPEHTVTLGLASMRERVTLVGGAFKITSEPMRGTRVEATVPIKPRLS